MFDFSKINNKADYEIYFKNERKYNILKSIINKNNKENKNNSFIITND